MLKRSSFYKIDFYKKEVYYGSFEGMRIRLAAKELPAEAEGEKPKKLLEGVVWCEPYAYDYTDESQKQRQCFEYSDLGIDEAVSWFEQKYKENESEFKASINRWDL